MNTTWTLRIEGDPIKLSDGSMLTPFAEDSDSRKSPTEGEKYMERLWCGVPDMVYPLGELVFKKLNDTRDEQIQAAEQKISNAKIEKAKIEAELAAKQAAEAAAVAAAEAKAKEDEQKKVEGSAAVKT